MYLLKFLFSFLFAIAFCQSYAQESIGEDAPEVLNPYALTTEIKDHLSEFGELDIIDTLKSPFGYVLNNAIIFKEKDKWIKIEIESFGDIDSIGRVNINNKGSKELILRFSHMDGRYNWSGGFSENYSI